MGGIAMKPFALAASAIALAFGTEVSAREVLHVVEHADTDTITDIGTKNDSVGDILTFANPVFDAANAKQVATSQGFCVRTTAGKSWECWWTLLLKDGQLTVQGPFLDKGDSVLAITGGTGKYAAARGQMKLHSRNDKGSEYDFVYEIE
jgi:hypothetical protein